MICGSDNKKLKLDLMKNMSIDEILELYRDGYRIEELQTCESIGCVSPDRYNAAVRSMELYGSASVLLTILGILGMIATYYVGRNSCKGKR